MPLVGALSVANLTLYGLDRLSTPFWMMRFCSVCDTRITATLAWILLHIAAAPRAAQCGLLCERPFVILSPRVVDRVSRAVSFTCHMFVCKFVPW